MVEASQPEKYKENKISFLERTKMNPWIIPDINRMEGGS